MAELIGKSVWGPQMWGQLHRSTTPKFLPSFIERIPCGQCRRMFVDRVLDNPPHMGMTSTEWRRWTWEIHNAVRRELKQETFTFAQAAARWGWPVPIHHDGSD